MHIIIGIMILKEIHARFGFGFGIGTIWGALMTLYPNQAVTAVCNGTRTGMECRDHYIHTMMVSS